MVLSGKRLTVAQLDRWRWLWHLLLAVPLLYLLWQIGLRPEQLGPDPAKSVLHFTGEWALYVMLAGLAVTPVARVLNQPAIIRWRRAGGLWAFTYALLHGLTYGVLYMGLDWQRITADVIEHPFVWIGLLALVLYLPLVITSTRNWQRRMGRNWVRLHRLFYVIGVLGLLHVTWLEKVGLLETWPYVAAFILLMLLRLLKRRKPAAVARHAGSSS